MSNVIYFYKNEEWFEWIGKEKLRLRPVYASPPLAARTTKNRSRPTAFVRFFSVTFLRLLECFAFLYRNRKNVIYSRHVKQNLP
jgi:hypothetical protein